MQVVEKQELYRKDKVIKLYMHTEIYACMCVKVEG